MAKSSLGLQITKGCGESWSFKFGGGSWHIKFSVGQGFDEEKGKQYVIYSIGFYGCHLQHQILRVSFTASDFTGVIRF